MADDQNPELPLTPPDPRDAASNAPPPAGSPPDDGPNSTVQGRGAAFMLSINIEDEMRRSYLDYSMSVIIGRALPDVRDGLKPVHRRILYGMQEMGLQFNKKYTKSAKVVGHVMGNYHPHGDSAIYDTMVRMAQEFSLRYPIIDGQGNFGSVDGDPPAAMRYTESRLTRIAGEMLADIDSDTVDFVPNYDESTQEPSVLPARIPNLIINGSSGIAVGMATNIPPHNLKEVVSAAIALLDKTSGNPDLVHRSDLDIVLDHVKGPDFPTAGILYGSSNIRQAYSTGRGRFMIRAKCKIENITGGRQAIIVQEIPYQVNKNTLIKRIAELIRENIIDDITGTEFRDESDRDGMRIYIPLKRGAQSEIVMNQLHKHTQMQESFSMIFLAVHNGQPKELPLDQAIRAFLDHRVEVVRRRTAFLLRKARDREEILEGLRFAVDNVPTVVLIIRSSGSRAQARENLYTWSRQGRVVIVRGIGRSAANELDWQTFSSSNPNVRFERDEKGFIVAATGVSSFRPTQPNDILRSLEVNGGLSYRQVDAILELQLYRLTQLSIDELLRELAEIRIAIAEYEEILGSPAKLRAVIVKELEEIRDKYGDPRRTQIVDETTELQLEDLIADEQVAVTVSNTGYLKRTPISIYRQQRRGGTGRLGMKTREEDFVAQLIIDSTHAFLLCFTNTGRVYWLKVYEIPDVGAAGKGKAMASLVDLQPGEKIVTILPVRDLNEEGKNILFATQKGTVKKTPLKDFSNVMARGIIAIGIDKDDELITARITDGQQVIFLATHDGMAIRFNEQDLRPMGRPAYGNKGIDLRKGDYLVGAAVTPSNESREAKRRELAEKKGLADALEAVRSEAGLPASTSSTLSSFREAGGSAFVPDAGQEILGSDIAISPAAQAKLDKLDKQLGLTPCLILSVSENGFGKRTDVDEYRLQSRGGKGVINMKTTPKIGKVTGINLVDDTTEMMVISQFGKIIRIDTKSIRAAGRSTQGVKLLDLEPQDKVAAAVVIPPEDEKIPLENGTLLQ